MQDFKACTSGVSAACSRLAAQNQSAVEVGGRLQIGIEDLLRLQHLVASTKNASLDGPLAVSIERIRAARQLSGFVANVLALGSLAGSVVFAFVGRAARLVRLACVLLVALLFIRAFFWSVA